MILLPLPLLLLIHIHLLGYPQADEPEYDEHVFNVKVRGLRDRTKTMEDLCYFLVGKIEQKPPRMKSLFPTYPCSQPSDSVAFKAVLARYLEGLRNQVVRPEILSKNQCTSSKWKKSPVPGTTPQPWWWKDVIVRKSLLEECTGIRFERMIIALSTHALFANITESLSAGASDTSAALTLLPALPRAHVSLEATIRGARRAWERSAVLLQQRQADSKHFETDATASRRHESNATLAALSFGQLVSLCETKRDELQRGVWQGEAGREYLDFAIALAGLSWPKLPVAHAEHVDVAKSYLSPEKKISTNEDLLPPLPTAAAHHPQHMVSFLNPVISTSFVTEDLRPAESSDCGQTRNSITRLVNVLITERLAAEEQTNNDFREALNRMRTMRESLQAQLRLIPEGASARAQSGNLADVPTPPASGKDVIVGTQIQKQAARSHAPNQATRMGRGSTARSAVFPVPKASQIRNRPPSRPRAPPRAQATVDPTQSSTRCLKQDALKHHSNQISRPPEPPTDVLPQSVGTDGLEVIPKVTHQSAGKAGPTTTQERNAPIIDLDEDEAFLPSDLKPDIKPLAPPKFDFIEDDSSVLPSFLKRDIIQMGPTRRQTSPTCASLASSRESTPEHDRLTPDAGGGKDEDDWSYEGKSMTLRDILVRAGDATFAHFDILHEEDVDVADETLGWE